MSNSEIIEKKYAEAVQGIKEEWFLNANNKWYKYVMGLPIQLQVTYLIVILHNQVFNGGFHQYFVNGYGQFAKETINALIEVGAIRKAELLAEAFEIVNIGNNSYEVFRNKLLKKEIKALFVGDDLSDSLNKLDNDYYLSEAEDINQLLGRYLFKKYPDGSDMSTQR
jgi:hypothetical protein